MVIPIPNTGSTITMGKVFRAYTNVSGGTGTGVNIALRGTLGNLRTPKITTGSISLSSSFGGIVGPFDYL